MTTLYCAECGETFEPDDEHVRIEAEHRRTDDRNETEEYAMHPECWRDLTAEWSDPV